MPLPFISQKTLHELQEHLTGWTLGEIRGLFGSADIPLAEDDQPDPSGQRRTLAAKYLKSVDTAKPEDVGKVLKVFELVFLRLEESAAVEERQAAAGQTGYPGRAELSRRTLERLVNWLRRDPKQGRGEERAASPFRVPVPTTTMFVPGRPRPARSVCVSSRPRADSRA